MCLQCNLDFTEEYIVTQLTALLEKAQYNTYDVLTINYLCMIYVGSYGPEASKLAEQILNAYANWLTQNTQSEQMDIYNKLIREAHKVQKCISDNCITDATQIRNLFRVGNDRNNIVMSMLQSA